MDDFASYQGKASPDEAVKAWEEEARRLSASFHGKGEGELLKAIYQKAIEGKRDGTLTNEQIDAFYRQLSPMLDGAKKKRLKQLVEELKKLPT